MSTAVLFRWWKGEVVALFPEIPADYEGRYVTSYAHMGQHSAADLRYIIMTSRPASANEYGDLKEELESIGYDDLVVKKKATSAMRQRLRENLKRYGPDADVKE